MTASLRSSMSRTLAAMTLGIAALSAQASLVGSTATCVISSGWSCNTATAPVVDPGAEFQLLLSPLGAFFSVDIDADSLTLTMVNQISAVGMGAGEIVTFGGLTAATAISDFTSSQFSPIGFGLNDITLSGGVLTAVLNQSTWYPGSWARVEFDLRAAVPEPGALALAGVALAAAGLARRRRA